jgi:hypothetical protein
MKDDLKQNLEVVVNDLMIIYSRTNDRDTKQSLRNCMDLLYKWY